MMMSLRETASMLGLILALAGPATPANVSSTSLMKHSGRVVGVDEAGGTIVLEEVGPWRVRNGQTVITYRTIEVTPATAFVLVSRADDTPSGFPKDFVESTLEPWELMQGDPVTIDCVHAGPRLIARRITVLQPDVP